MLRFLRHLVPLLMLALILLSNAMLVQPREMTSDVTWLLQDSARKETARDIRRIGALQVTPTRVQGGSLVRVTVAEGLPRVTRALVMIDSEGNHLDVRYDPLRTQGFIIPEDGVPGDYRFWLTGATLHPRNGLGVITVEVEGK